MMQVGNKLPPDKDKVKKENNLKEEEISKEISRIVIII